MTAEEMRARIVREFEYGRTLTSGVLAVFCDEYPSKEDYEQCLSIAGRLLTVRRGLYWTIGPAILRPADLTR